MMSQNLRQQYAYIRQTRQVLFSFLETIPLPELHTPIDGFGSGSIIRTHIHVADCYRYWLGSFAFQQRRGAFEFAADREIEQANLSDVRVRFDSADEVVERFLNTFESRMLEPVSNEVKWRPEPWSATPLWLLTHTETHEFHHKGQIVAMTRHLGFTPPDTDLAEAAL